MIPSRDREHLLTAKSDVCLTDYTSFYSKGLLISFPLVEINKAALGLGWEAVLALRYADTLKPGKALFGGS
jgi:hypothetical protein